MTCDAQVLLWAACEEERSTGKAAEEEAEGQGQDFGRVWYALASSVCCAALCCADRALLCCAALWQPWIVMFMEQ